MTAPTTDAFIYGGCRTPFGRHAGALAGIRPDDLLAQSIAHLIAQTQIAPADVEDVIVGCTNQAGEDSRNVARRAALLAGLPLEVAALTVNRLCGSGLAALLDAARTVRCGEGDLVIAGGVESMSRAPFVLGKADQPFSRDISIFDSTMGSRFPNPRFTALYGDHTMPETADLVGQRLGITREASDHFAAASQRKYEAARVRGFFDEEIHGVDLPAEKHGKPGKDGKQPAACVDRDEHPRADSTIDRLARLKPLYEGGLVTAGNASGVNDGAAALLVASAAYGERTGLKPLARVVAGAAAGVEPAVMGLGPVPASRKVLARTKLSLADMDVIEINEAFATQVLGCLTQLELDFEDPRVNPNGGAIAVGHPLGASGARLALTAMRQLHATNGRYALVTMCIGVGQGIAAILERV
jgi:3-oxoadipyl-CoA thiolase